MNIPAIVPHRKILHKLTLTFFAFGVTAIIYSGIAIHLGFQTAERAAMTEAEDVANTIITSGVRNRLLDVALLQEQMLEFHTAFKRDVFAVDNKELIFASAEPAEIGQLFTQDRYLDPENTIALTLADGKTRAFSEFNPRLSETEKRCVVAIHKDVLDQGSPVIGTLVLEYTPSFKALMSEANATNKILALFILVLSLVNFLLCRSLTLSILKPINHLRRAVDAIATGDRDARIKTSSKDEIGALGHAFNRMADELRAGDVRAKKKDRELAATMDQLAAANQQLQQEIEEHRRSADQVEYLAYFDSLTGLPNRTMLSRFLVRDMNHAHRYGTQLGVLCIDLDQLKKINDTLGHKAGDDLLCEVSLRLKKCLRNSDSCARWGGDEFVVLIPELQEEHHLETIARKINAVLNESFFIHDHTFFITASIGISIYPEDGADEITLVKNADIALHHAKKSGQNNFQFYSDKMNLNSLQRFALEASLRVALEHNEFKVVYQAKVDSISHRITGMEALIRWTHPSIGPIGPDEFIPLAEVNGLIVPIGKWVLRTACLQHAIWREKGYPQLQLAVNLSARQLSDVDLLEDIAEILEQTGMNPTLLELEITESVVIRDMTQAMHIFHAIKAMGIRLVMDDFGTGYSSLSIIKQFPLDAIKIDRSFIRDMPGDADANAITTAIIAMSKVLGLGVVAEGVETLAQVNTLKDLGCETLQGYYFNEPMHADRFFALLETNATVTAPEVLVLG